MQKDSPEIADFFQAILLKFIKDTGISKQLGLEKALEGTEELINEGLLRVTSETRNGEEGFGLEIWNFETGEYITV